MQISINESGAGKNLGLKRGTVAVVPHDPDWALIAAKTIERLHDILQDAAEDIRHVGSTAIDGICAKPIIDIAVGVCSFDVLLSRNGTLEENGFIFRGQDHPGQYLYICGSGDYITHHIHAVIYGSAEWDGYVNFTNYLNSHKADAAAYSELKKRLAQKYPLDRKTYTAMKSDFITSILKKAEEEPL